MSFLFGTTHMPLPDPRSLGLRTYQGSTNAQADPLPYLAGRRRFAGTFITDAFDERTYIVQANGGKGGSVRTGVNYYASFAVAACLGAGTGAAQMGFHDLWLNGQPVFASRVPLWPAVLTQTDNVASFQTQNPHGLSSGDVVIVYGATQPEFNGEFVVTVPTDPGTGHPSAYIFQYVIPGTSLQSERASGDIAAYVKLDPILRAGEESVEVTIPNYGVITLHWGGETQPADAYLPVSGVQHPPYRGVLYAVFKQFFLGLNQTSIQNVEFVLSRLPTADWLLDPGHATVRTGPTLTDNEANPAVVIHELLTHPRLGLGFTDADFNVASFAAAAGTLWNESFGISGIIDRADSASTFVQQILETIDGLLTLDGQGLLQLSLARQPADLSGLPTVGDADLADLPQPKARDWSSCHSETRITFPNAAAAFVNDMVEWKDNGALAAMDNPSPNDLQRDWVTSKTLALALVQGAGQTAAIPPLTGKLTLLYGAPLWNALAPGALFNLDYSLRPDAGGVYRVTSRSLQKTGTPAFEIEFSDDHTYLYLPLQPSPQAQIIGNPIAPALEATPLPDFLLAQLPADLSPGGKVTLAPLLARWNPMITSATLWLGRNYAFNGSPPASFLPLATLHKFAFHGFATADFPASTPFVAVANPPPAPLSSESPFPLAAGLIVRLDGCDTVLPEAFDFDALANALLLFAGGEIMSVAESSLRADGTYSLTVIRARYGTAIADHPAGDEVLLIPLADLTSLQHPLFAAGNVVQFLLTIGRQTIADAQPFNFPFGALQGVAGGRILGPGAGPVFPV